MITKLWKRICWFHSIPLKNTWLPKWIRFMILFGFWDSWTLRVNLESFFHVYINESFPFQCSELFLSTYYVQSNSVRGSKTKVRFFQFSWRWMYQVKRFWGKDTEKGGCHWREMWLQMSWFLFSCFQVFLRSKHESFLLTCLLSPAIGRRSISLKPSYLCAFPVPSPWLPQILVWLLMQIHRVSQEKTHLLSCLFICGLFLFRSPPVSFSWICIHCLFH